MEKPINTNLIEEEEYNYHFDYFKEILQHAINTSKLGGYRIFTDDRKILYTCILFARLCTIGQSIVLLCSEKKRSDYNSVFSLSRNIIDCSHMLYYLYFDDICEKERELRLLGLILYDLNDRQRLMSLWEDGFNDITDTLMFNVIRHSYGLNFIRVFLEEYKKKIKFNECFLLLDTETQDSILRGAHHFIKTTPEKIDKAMGIINKNCYKALYKTLSSSVHSFPMTNNTNYIYGLGAETVYERSFKAYALYHCADYLKFCTKNIIEKLYFNYKETFDDDEMDDLELILGEVSRTHRDPDRCL